MTSEIRTNAEKVTLGMVITSGSFRDEVADFIDSGLKGTPYTL